MNAADCNEKRSRHFKIDSSGFYFSLLDIVPVCSPCSHNEYTLLMFLTLALVTFSSTSNFV